MHPSSDEDIFNPISEYHYEKKRNFIPRNVSIMLIGISLMLLSIVIFFSPNPVMKEKVAFVNLNSKVLHTNKKYSHNVKFSIALKQKNTGFLRKTLLDISNPKSINYGKYWTRKKIQNLVSPNIDDNKKVIKWLKKNGINDNEIINYGDSIVCNTNIFKIEKLFDMRMKKYYFLNISVFASNTDYKIPKYLSNVIEFVEGISKIYNKTILKSYRHKNIEVDSGYAGREVVKRLYDIIDDTILDNKQSVCAIEYSLQSGFNQSNLLKSQELNSEDKKNINDKNIIGTYTGISDVESELDIQMISQTAENVNILFYNTNNWLYSSSIDFFNMEKIPDILSISWGGNEDEQCTVSECTAKSSTQYIDRVNIEYVKIGMRGTSIVVSSGDSGAPGNSENCNVKSPVNPIFPGSSPWVTSIGATFVVNLQNVYWNYHTPLCIENKCAMGIEEIGATFNYTGWTAGGGFSTYSSETTPKWQQKFVNKYLTLVEKLPSNFRKNGRSYPDISVVGHKCPIFIGYILSGVDGTSCSAPIFASILSILNQYQNNRGKPKLGFFTPMLYAMAENDPYIFNDISYGYNWCTENSCCPTKNGGSDFGYKATKGYDPVTGLGTPNIKKMMKWLQENI